MNDPNDPYGLRPFVHAGARLLYERGPDDWLPTLWKRLQEPDCNILQMLYQSVEDGCTQLGISPTEIHKYGFTVEENGSENTEDACEWLRGLWKEEMGLYD